MSHKRKCVKEKKLTYKELYELEDNLNKIENIKKDLKAIELGIEIAKYKSQIYDFMIKDEARKISKAQDEKCALNNAMDGINDAREDVLKGIRKRLKLSGRFGFNPDTLEIVEDDK